MNIRDFEFIPVRRPKGMVKVQLAPKPEGHIFKDRAAWLLEALGAYYSHRAGHCLTPERAKAFSILYKGGWHATMRLAARDKTPYRFFLEDENGKSGEKLTLKAALLKAGEINNIS
jgi:hypothetical protein